MGYIREMEADLGHWMSSETLGYRPKIKTLREKLGTFAARSIPLTVVGGDAAAGTWILFLGRYAAAAGTRIFRGDTSRRRRGCHVDSPKGRRAD